MEAFQEFRNTDTDIEENWSFSELSRLKQQHYTQKKAYVLFKDQYHTVLEESRG